MPLPEYVQTWLTGFDESSEPVDCSLISLILYTRLAERQTPPDEVKAIFRVLGKRPKFLSITHNSALTPGR